MKKQKEELNIKINEKTNLKREKGITLIALVLTIIVLLILAAVTINVIMGENGILSKSQKASYEYGLSQIIEEIGLDILNKQMDCLSNRTLISSTQLEEILKNYGEVIYDDDLIPIGVKIEEYEDVYLDDIWNGDRAPEEDITIDGLGTCTYGELKDILEELIEESQNDIGEGITLTYDSDTNSYYIQHYLDDEPQKI